MEHNANVKWTIFFNAFAVYIASIVTCELGDVEVIFACHQSRSASM